jgi:hypothetical protein
LPNLPSLTTSCVALELRPLPSTGITRLQQYYEPLRHPVTPGLSLAGCRLILMLDHVMGFPCCIDVPLIRMPSPISRRNARVLLSLASPDMAAFPEISVGSASASPFSRPAQRSLTLRPAYSPSHPTDDPYTRGFNRLSLCGCSDCYRLERQLPGGIRTHWDAVPFHGARGVEMWRGGGRSISTVAAPFVWRCLNRWTMTPFPHPAHRTGRALFRHPAPGQGITRSPTEGAASAEASGRDPTSRIGARQDSRSELPALPCASCRATDAAGTSCARRAPGTPC